MKKARKERFLQLNQCAKWQMKMIRTRQCQQLFKFHVSRSTLCELFLGRDSILSCGDSVVKPNGSCNMKSGWFEMKKKARRPLTFWSNHCFVLSHKIQNRKKKSFQKYRLSLMHRVSESTCFCYWTATTKKVKLWAALSIRNRNTSLSSGNFI